MIGALAEFHHGAAPSERLDEWTVLSAEGGVRIAPSAEMRLVAYEMVSADPECWVHGVALCAPESSVRPSRAITELGPDAQALRAEDRSGVLFDLGLGSAAARFCVRVFDDGQIRTLRKSEGRPLLGAEHALYHELQRWSPHRVVLTALGRIEVTAPIAKDHSPSGSHTHLIPKLLRPSRSAPSYVPVPEGWEAAMIMYPANPLRDAAGKRKPFSPEEHRQFQEILRRFGPQDSERYARIARRVAERQARATSGVRSSI